MYLSTIATYLSSFSIMIYRSFALLPLGLYTSLVSATPVSATPLWISTLETPCVCDTYTISVCGGVPLYQLQIVGANSEQLVGTTTVNIGQQTSVS